MMHAAVNSSFPANSSGEALVMDYLGHHPDDSLAPGGTAEIPAVEG